MVMKREWYVFLCVAAALFFASCSNFADLSVDNEKSVKADLPNGFNWNVYGEINGDVLMSQIILDLRKTKRGDDSVKNCIDILSADMNFAKEVYEDYLQCPVDGWNKNEKCPGKYAYNSNYNKPTVTMDTTITRDTVITDIVDPDDGTPVLNPDDGTPMQDTTITINTIITRDTAWCAIGTCWSDGWSEAKYLETSKTNSGAIKSMCQFIPENSTPEDAKKYLNNFPFDSVLVEQHYHFFGRSDGRPYRYCEGVNKGDEKDQDKHADKRGNNYYDYGRYTFCLDKNDQKIYVVE